MKAIWTNKTLSAALGINLPIKAEYGAIQYNSQDVKPGEIFIAMPADALPTIKDTKDSHPYVKDALARGATIAIVEHKVDGIDPTKLLIVPNAFKALQKMAKYKRDKSNATFITITGSAGKTSTKEATCAALSQFAETFANPGTFNNELGVPLTLASMPDSAKYVVMEIGMNSPGEIKALIPAIAPDLVMINNILPVHLANFASLDEIADAKLEILEGLKKGGIAIFNANSQYYEHCCKQAQEKGAGKILGFGDEASIPRHPGLDPGSSTLMNDISKNWVPASAGMTGRHSPITPNTLLEYKFENDLSHITASIADEKISFTTPITGRHRALNLVAALTICHALGLDPAKASKAFAHSISPKGRGQIHNVTFNGHKCIIIDDAYNAGPASTIASLQHLKDLPHDNKIVILGNMMELGPKEIEFHQSLLPYIIDAGVKKVYTSGILMHELYKIVPPSMQGRHFKDYTEVEAHLNDIINDDMMILLKGSKSQKLAHVVSVLTSK